jgi:tetratricopeptide (TPR) repeat protein
MYKEAEEQARAALSLRPTSKAALMNLIRALIGQSRLDEAERTARELTQRSNTSDRKSNAYLLLAQVHEARGEFEQALADLDRAVGYMASPQIRSLRERIVRLSSPSSFTLSSNTDCTSVLGPMPWPSGGDVSVLNAMFSLPGGVPISTR